MSGADEDPTENQQDELPPVSTQQAHEFQMERQSRMMSDMQLDFQRSMGNMQGFLAKLSDRMGDMNDTIEERTSRRDSFIPASTKKAERRKALDQDLNLRGNSASYLNMDDEYYEEEVEQERRAERIQFNDAHHEEEEEDQEALRLALHLSEEEEEERKLANRATIPERASKLQKPTKKEDSWDKELRQNSESVPEREIVITRVER
jgi:hypothetical protein